MDSPIFLEIRQDFCEKNSCQRPKFLGAEHNVSFQTSPNVSIETSNALTQDFEVFSKSRSVMEATTAIRVKAIAMELYGKCRIIT